jgi:hypothetical protein
MAKVARKGKRDGGNNDAAQANSATGAEGETVAGYFRRIFAENPRWLRSRSNDQALRRWLADHPGETTVPERVKAGMSNIKAVLRKRRRGRRKAAAAQRAEAPAETAVAAPSPPQGGRGAHKLEALEERIDQCLDFAKDLDRQALETVIKLLLVARREVVWKMGQ